jgi:hypothetical protein
MWATGPKPCRNLRIIILVKRSSQPISLASSLARKQIDVRPRMGQNPHESSILNIEMGDACVYGVAHFFFNSSKRPTAGANDFVF